MTKKLKRAKKRKTRPDKLPEGIHLTSYDITYDPIEEDYIKRLPETVKERINVLHGLAQKKPEQALAELLELKEKYPDVPTLFNYLYAAYLGLKERDKAKAVLLECCEKFPDYLFGKLNLAGIYLREGKPEKIPEIFDNKFDLSLLYPDRRLFHISEYVAFASTIGLYFCEIDKPETAEILLNTLEELAPEHPLTERLRMMILPAIIKRDFEMLTEKTKKGRTKKNSTQKQEGAK